VSHRARGGAHRGEFVVATNPYQFGQRPTGCPTASTFRLQIRVTSYDVPTQAPWSVAFDIADPASVQIRPMLPATNEILQGGADPSYLLIPVADVGVP
jgi:hypothetical protein